MKHLKEFAGLSRIHTNHYFRATNLNVLDSALHCLSQGTSPSNHQRRISHFVIYPWHRYGSEFEEEHMLFYFRFINSDIYLRVTFL